MSTNQTVTAIEVVRLSDGEVVHTVPVTRGNDPDRVMIGLLRNMDTDLYCAREAFGGASC